MKVVWHRPRVERMYRDGKPVCAECGDYINPEDYGGIGKKRADAVFCNGYCRNRSRSGSIAATKKYGRAAQPVEEEK